MLQSLQQFAANPKEVLTGGGLYNAGDPGQDLQNRDFTISVAKIVTVLMYAAGAVTIIMIVVGGIQYATSSGDEAKVKQARGSVIGALVGLVIAVLSWALTTFVLRAVQ